MQVTGKAPCDVSHSTLPESVQSARDMELECKFEEADKTVEFGFSGALVRRFLLRWTIAPCLTFEHQLPDVVECAMSLISQGGPQGKFHKVHIYTDRSTHVSADELR